jgi:hypothetical protein
VLLQPPSRNVADVPVEQALGAYRRLCGLEPAAAQPAAGR